jgi:hypothetical protein
MFQKRISNYEINYYAGKIISEKHHLSKIILFGEDNTSIGELYFHRHTDTLIDKDYQSESGVIVCNFLAEDFCNILDLLRKERSFLTYNDLEKVGFITTTRY